MQTEDHTKELMTAVSGKGECRKPDGSVQECMDMLIHEHFLEVSVNGYTAMRLSCTAEHLKELVIGRLYTEGLIRSADDIGRLFLCAKGNIAEVTLREGISVQPYQGNEPTCCTGNRQFLTGKKNLQKLPEVQIDPAAVFTLAEYFRADSRWHRTTSGTHSCYLYLPDGEIAWFEDISRHNALDKAAGYMLMAEADPAKCMFYTTGRVPADMVEKTVMAGVPVLVSKSVPTDVAVEMAKEYGLKLICKAWPDSYTIYG